MDHQARRDRLRKAFQKAGIDALLVTDFTNVTYLTGFTGDDSYLLVRRDGETVLSDPRYIDPIGRRVSGRGPASSVRRDDHAPGGGAGRAGRADRPAGD